MLQILLLNKKKFLIAFIILVTLIIFAIMMITKDNTPSKSPNNLSSEPRPTPPVIISKPLPQPLIIPSQGILEKIDSANVTIKTGTGSATLAISKQTDVQKLISGSLEKGDTKTEPSLLSALQTGQQVLVVAETKTPSLVRFILIVK